MLKDYFYMSDDAMHLSDVMPAPSCEPGGLTGL